jgi:hypothetical protein
MLKLANDTHRGRAHRVSAPNEATLKCQKHSWLCLTNGAFRWKRAAAAAFASIARNSFALIIHCEILFYAFSYREKRSSKRAADRARRYLWRRFSFVCVFAHNFILCVRWPLRNSPSPRARFSRVRGSVCARAKRAALTSTKGRMAWLLKMNSGAAVENISENWPARRELFLWLCSEGQISPVVQRAESD